MIVPVLPSVCRIVTMSVNSFDRWRACTARCNVSVGIDKLLPMPLEAVCLCGHKKLRVKDQMGYKYYKPNAKKDGVSMSECV